MLQAMFSGVSGLQANQTKMDVIGNNIANVNTVGFKAGRVSFEDQLSQTLRSASAPSANQGGTGPEQVGLGVMTGAIDTLQSQGNLQTTGKTTDLAIQGDGLFMVSKGNGIQYTRDGNFDVDAAGNLVNKATGVRLLGYSANQNGVIDTTVPIDGNSTLQIPVGVLTTVQQTNNATFAGNLDASSALISTKVDYAGNLDSTATPSTSIPAPRTVTVYDGLGNPHTVQMTFSNPVDNPAAGAGVPAGATRSWDVVVSVDGTSAYDSTAGKAKLYYAGGAWQLGTTGSATIALDGATGANHGTIVPGTNGASAFPVNLNLGALTANSASSTLTGTVDGQSGSAPFATTSTRVYDSLGVGHLVTFKYSRVPLGAGAPPGATAQWDWTASENGTVISGSTSTGNSSLFFDANGNLVSGTTQTLTVTPKDGSASPFTVKIDNSKIVQLASGASVNAQSQDGYPVGTLQSFSISSDGVISGAFTNGQSRALGQIAMSSFANPAGLEKAGNNLFNSTSNSGTPQVGLAGQAGKGTLNPGFLEMSNVDLSTEFTNLIVTQRGFQANTRIVSVVDQLLQDVIDLKR